ncbi:MAG: 3-methyl-2-oxobutanoate hydroxymethyltransferase, partial [Acidobacteriota bacterium]|nr:3-methyl-2-oxobutanoate hydroxymethyltransferase [Acidobacteriota bacterium]
MDPVHEAVSKVTVPYLTQKKLRGEKIACLTAYDYPTARLADECGIDVILVGDSLGTTVLGYDTTLPVTIEDVIYHCRAVRRAVRRAMVVADLPFGSYHVSDEQGVASAIRCIKEGGAEAVKIEGGAKRSALIRRAATAEIPLMGHVGLTPQSVLHFGGHRVQGKSPEQAADILADAAAVEEAGAFTMVVEGVPRELAAVITGRSRIPVIGIGAGPACDGQVLVVHDLLGISPDPRPKFVRPYANVRGIMREAFRQYREDVV